MLNGSKCNIIYDTNTHLAIIKFIQENIITDSTEFLEELDKINQVAAREENIKIYRFVKELEDMDHLKILGDDINELKKILTENIILELEFYDELNSNGQL